MHLDRNSLEKRRFLVGVFYQLRTVTFFTERKRRLRARCIFLSANGKPLGFYRLIDIILDLLLLRKFSVGELLASQLDQGLVVLVVDAL